MTTPIYLIESQSRQDLAETFMRFQEYYESPEFAGRAFTADEFAAWYAAQHGAFTYHQDWSGFNIPSWVLRPFHDGAFNPLTEKERRLVDFFHDKKGDFYIIGATTADEWYADTVRHEFAHGAFFTNAAYRADVQRYIRTHRPDVIKVALQEMGYRNEVLEDEVNAYLLTEPQTMADEINLNDGRKIREGLDAIFRKYFGFSMATSPVECIQHRIERVGI